MSLRRIFLGCALGIAALAGAAAVFVMLPLPDGLLERPAHPTSSWSIAPARRSAPPGPPTGRSPNGLRSRKSTPRSWWHSWPRRIALLRACRRGSAGAGTRAGCGPAGPENRLRCLDDPDAAGPAAPSPVTLGSGKLAQMLWALRLDAHLSKQVILEQYLNRVPLGQGAVGVEAASALYFGASARDLSTGQAALLAAVAGAPSTSAGQRQARDGAPAHRPRADAADRIAHRRGSRARRAGAAAHRLGEPLLPRPALHRGAARKAGQGGAKPDRTSPHPARSPAAGKPRSGGAAHGGHDAHLGSAPCRGRRPRQPFRRHPGLGRLPRFLRAGERPGGYGDFAAPAGLGAQAVSVRSRLRSRLHPASILPDVATVYRPAPVPTRRAITTAGFTGRSAPEALGSSFNLPAVELASRLGTAELMATLTRADSRPGARCRALWARALGNGDVTLLELANGYRAIANGGVFGPVRWLADEGPGAESRRVMSAGAAALVTDILADPVARIPGFGPVTPLEFPFPPPPRPAPAVTSPTTGRSR